MSKQTNFDKLDLLGVEVDALTNDEAIAYICRRAAPGQPAGYVTKPYVEFLDQAYSHPKLQDLLNEAELTLADGVALTWAAAYLYAGPHSAWRFWKTLFQIILAPGELRWPLPDRTAGIIFTRPLLEAAAAANLRVFLIGAPAGSSIHATADALHQLVPDLDIAGSLSGRDLTRPLGQVSNDWLGRTAAAVTAAKADIILVGMGFPLQEQVCRHLAAHTNHGMYLGEGGTFDYAAFGGRRRKAPALVQRLGLEWLWRLSLEPRRLRRQLAIPRFIYRVWQAR